MNIFNPYLQVIKKAMDKDPKWQQRNFNSNINEAEFNLDHIVGLRNELSQIQNLNESNVIQKGHTTEIAKGLPPLGSHPDFIHLKETDKTEDHWIISGFIDVKESTRLFNRFTKATVALITEGIVRASIFAVTYCGGYVHRIQGDGLMVYFGGKNKDKKESTENALKAFAMISYFVKNDLKEYFEANQIKEIFTRAALDLGHDNQVRWSYSGLGNVGEVTTCSLHTSLVPKMQAKAKSNGITVGKNLTNQVNGERYFEKRGTPIWDYEDGRYYDFYDFNWETYLVEKKIAVEDQYGALILAIDFNGSKPEVNNLFPIASQSKPYFE